MSGIIGRTHEGQALDRYIATIQDKRLRRRVHRTLGQIDRDFVTNNEWENGVAYKWWPAEIKKKYYKRSQETLRELMIDYVKSIFDYDYMPQTKTQLALYHKDLQHHVEAAANDEAKQVCEFIVFLTFATPLIFALVWLLIFVETR